MTLHRFFLPLESITSERVLFPPDQARQISSVLRLRTGDRVIVLDGTGIEYVVRLTDDGGIVEERRQNRSEPSVTVSLYQGILKRTRLEMVLQKCTEIGVSRFVPIHTTRSVPAEPSEPKLRRYQAIVREAAEQSGRGKIPAIGAPMTYRDALKDATQRGPVIVPWEEAQGLTLQESALPSAREVGLVIGPEGGFSSEEIEDARAMGAQVITLGPRTLRAETAAIVASGLLLARLEASPSG